MIDNFAEQGMMRTAHGWVSLLDPKPEQIHIDDIAYALGNLNRFTGHSEISVLEHSCRSYLFACDQGVDDPKRLLTVLLHDAQEAYISDVSQPLKIAMRNLAGVETSIYDGIEDRVASAIAQKWGLYDVKSYFVKDADRAALAAEVELIWGPLEVASWGLDRQDRLCEFAPNPATKNFFKHVFDSLTARL